MQELKKAEETFLRLAEEAGNPEYARRNRYAATLTGQFAEALDQYVVPPSDPATEISTLAAPGQLDEALLQASMDDIIAKAMTVGEHLHTLEDGVALRLKAYGEMINRRIMADSKTHGLPILAKVYPFQPPAIRKPMKLPDSSDEVSVRYSEFGRYKRHIGGANEILGYAVDVNDGVSSAKVQYTFLPGNEIATVRVNLSSNLSRGSNNSFLRQMLGEPYAEVEKYLHEEGQMSSWDLIEIDLSKREICFLGVNSWGTKGMRIFSFDELENAFRNTNSSLVISANLFLNFFEKVLSLTKGVDTNTLQVG